MKQTLISNPSALKRNYIWNIVLIVLLEINCTRTLPAAGWEFSKQAGLAYGIDEPLLIYRVSASSKSGNKLHAAKMNWPTYRYLGLNILAAGYYMVWYTLKGLLKYRNLKIRGKRI